MGVPVHLRHEPGGRPACPHPGQGQARPRHPPEGTPKTVILEEVDPNDAEAGKEHAKKGWPRTVAIADDDGNERIASYQLIDPKDQKSVAEAISAEEATQRAFAVERPRQAPANPTNIHPEDVNSHKGDSA